MNKKTDIINSIKVIISPWEKGFSCGIIVNQASKMTSKEYELCSTIARGMIQFANDEPSSAFKLGLNGFVDDRKNNNMPKALECIAETTHDAEEEHEVIDFIEALKKRRDKKLS